MRFLPPIGAGKEGGRELAILFTLFTTALAVVFTWVYNNTRGSLLIEALLHASLSTTEHSLKLLMPSLKETARPTILYGVSMLTVAMLLALIAGPKLSTRSVRGSRASLKDVERAATETSPRGTRSAVKPSRARGSAACQTKLAR